MFCIWCQAKEVADEPPLKKRIVCSIECLIEMDTAYPTLEERDKFLKEQVKYLSSLRPEFL